MTRPYLSTELRRLVAQDANHRCGYCLCDEALTGTPMTVDHIVSLAAGGSSERDNLWLACRACNEFKHTRIDAEDPDTGELAPLFNPRTHLWNAHFSWSVDRTQILGLSSVGRATVIVLQLNRPMLVKARRRWVLIGRPPAED